jgi:hypothetical protein
MNAKEVISCWLGVVGFLILRIIYLGSEILSGNGTDIRWLVFGFGLILFFLFAFFLGQENK